MISPFKLNGGSESKIMTKDLLKLINKYFKYLFVDFGFKVIETKYTFSFLNALVTLRSDELQIRFVRDHNIIAVEIASVPIRKRYFELDFIWIMLENGLITETPMRVNLDRTADFLHDHYLEIKQKFSSDEVEKTITELVRLKEEWIRWEYPGTTQS